MKATFLSLVLVGFALASVTVPTTAVALAAGTAGQQSTSVYLQADGYANVVEYLDVISSVPVNVSLMGVPQALTVTYAGGQPVLYTVASGMVQILPNENSTVEINYLTLSLVLKNSVSWSANLTLTSTANLYLPDGATLLYINHQLTSISTTGNQLTLVLPAGSWTVGYVLNAGGSGTPPAHGVPAQIYELIAAAVVAAVAVVLLVLFLVRRRRRAAMDLSLNVTDNQIVAYLKKRGGSALESEIRRDLIIPKTSEWRAIKRLERQGVARVEKVNKENRVILV